MATIARPPVDPAHKRPSTDYTGYIICIYQVFKGDDGEKFERNWLYWTGEEKQRGCEEKEILLYCLQELGCCTKTFPETLVFAA